MFISRQIIIDASLSQYFKHEGTLDITSQAQGTPNDYIYSSQYISTMVTGMDAPYIFVNNPPLQMAKQITGVSGKLNERQDLLIV